MGSLLSSNMTSIIHEKNPIFLPFLQQRPFDFFYKNDKRDSYCIPKDPQMNEVVLTLHRHNESGPFEWEITPYDRKE